MAKFTQTSFASGLQGAWSTVVEPRSALQWRPRSSEIKATRKDRSSGRMSRPTQVSFEDQTVRMVASLRLPFTALDNLQFRRWVKTIQDLPAHVEVQFPLATQIPQLLAQQVSAAVEMALREVPPHAKIAVALNRWTSPDLTSFLVVTGYFIDAAWRHQEIVLGFEPLPEQPTGREISDRVIYCLGRWAVLPHQLLTVAGDLSASDETFHDELDRALHEMTVARLGERVSASKVPPLAHTVELAVRRFLYAVKIHACDPDIAETRDSAAADLPPRDPVSETDEVAWTLQKLRDAVSTISSTPQRHARFQELQLGDKQLALVGDDDTSWRSMLAMVVRARRLRRTLARYSSQYPAEEVHQFQADEWLQMDQLVEVLIPFARLTDAMKKTVNEPTVQLVMSVCDKLRLHLAVCEARLARKSLSWQRVIWRAVQVAMDGFTRSYDDIRRSMGRLCACAMILDPQVKTSWLDKDHWTTESTKASTFKQECLAYLQELQRSHANQLRAENASVSRAPFGAGWSHASGTTSSRAVSPAKASTDPSNSAQTGAKRKRIDLQTLLLGEKRRRTTVDEHLAGDLDVYLRDTTHFGIDDWDDFEHPILEYWRRAEKRFPILARVARDVLAIPATGMGVERLFCQAGDIARHRRHRLKPSTLSGLVMVMCTDRFSMKEEFRQTATDDENGLEHQALTDDDEANDDILNDELDEAEDDDHTILDDSDGAECSILTGRNEDGKREDDTNDEVGNGVGVPKSEADDFEFIAWTHKVSSTDVFEQGASSPSLPVTRHRNRLPVRFHSPHL